MSKEKDAESEITIPKDIAEDLLEALLDLMGEWNWKRKESRHGYSDEMERLDKLKERAIKVIRNF